MENLPFYLYLSGKETRALLTAIAMAIFDSVTVSMGDDTNGAFKESFFVNADVRS